MVNENIRYMVPSMEMPNPYEAGEYVSPSTCGNWLIKVYFDGADWFTGDKATKIAKPHRYYTLE